MNGRGNKPYWDGNAYPSVRIISVYRRKEEMNKPGTPFARRDSYDNQELEGLKILVTRGLVSVEALTCPHCSKQFVRYKLTPEAESMLADMGPEWEISKEKRKD